MKKCKAKSLLKKSAKILVHPLIAIICGILVGAVVIFLAGENPLDVYVQMFQKSFLNIYYLLQTLTRSVPIIVCSLSVIISWKAGYINLGTEGQMIAGGFVGTIVAIYMPGPTYLVMAAAFIAAMATGAVLSLFSAFIFDKFGVSIVISTLMMNYAINYITNYFITFPLRDTGSSLAIQSKEIPVAMKLPRLVEGNTYNLGFIIAALLVAAITFIIFKTNFGYESKMTGLNPIFAQYGGIKKGRVMYSTMALSGMLAAVAGLLEIFGVKYRFLEGMFTSTSYAWTGLMSGLISSLNPIGAFFVSIFLSGMQVGGTAIQRTTSIPLQVSTLIQATITLFVSVKITINFAKKKKFVSRGTNSAKKVGEE